MEQGEKLEKISRELSSLADDESSDDLKELYSNELFKFNNLCFDLYELDKDEKHIVMNYFK